jgi:hypothetical protein
MFDFEKGFFVNKLDLACMIFLPLIGCTGIVAEGDGNIGGASGTISAGNSGSSAGSTTSIGSSAGAGSTATSGGSGTVSAAGGPATSGGASNGGACTVDALPSGVQAMLSSECSACHGPTPLSGLPSLVTYANLTAPSRTDPTKTNAALALARIQSATTPMPPAPASHVSAADTSALQAFVMQGYPKQSCPSGSAGAESGGATFGGAANGGAGAGGAANGGAGAGGAANGGAGAGGSGMITQVCTSKKTWTNGNGTDMRPGNDCTGCHSNFVVAGTVYPTLDEPNNCDGTGAGGIKVLITGADNVTLTLTPSATSGNFYSSSSVKTPYSVKLTNSAGASRSMVAHQTAGNCNSCHTPTGANGAPGRITAP